MSPPSLHEPSQAYDLLPLEGGGLRWGWDFHQAEGLIPHRRSTPILTLPPRGGRDCAPGRLRAGVAP